MITLSNATLADLPDGVLRPAYDRSALKAGILHIGLGNFHRAHQSWYLHRLMQQNMALDWAIVGAGVTAYDNAMREKLAAKDYLTTLIELDPKGQSAEVVGSMIDYVPVAKGNGPLIARMAQPDIRIVSMTVTEGGYFIDPATGAFDAAHPAIVHDAANPDVPDTTFGAIVAALRLRRDSGAGPFTCQSCDNLQGNGHVMRQTILGLARLSDPDLANWIDAHCTFPDSMVDCIVPATGPAEVALAESYGIQDAAPVTHENFRQWVIEDAFCAGRPDWDRVGAIFSDNVHGYETQKIRILNAGHQIIVNAAEVLGIQTIADTMAHDGIRALFRRVAEVEIVPHVDPVPGMTPLEYVDLIDTRFANPAIRDTVKRVAFDGSSRHPGFVVPTIRKALASGRPFAGLALVQALWARMCLGTREDGSVIVPNDPHWDMLLGVAAQAKANPQAWLGMRQFYGDLGDDAAFAKVFADWLHLIYADGVEAAIQRYLGHGL